MIGSNSIYRRPLIVALDLLLVALANYLAFWLLFDGTIPAHERDVFLQALPWLVLVRGVVFVLFGVYKGVWRYTGLWELQRLAGAVVVSSLVADALTRWWLGVAGYPRSVTIIDALVLVFLTGGVRLSRQFFAQFLGTKGKRRVLIVGAGDAGETIVRDMKRRQDHELVGFVDDDRSKVGQSIHGVPVLGTRDDLARLMTEHHPQELLIAIPSAHATLVQSIVEILRPFKVRITTVPNQRSLMDGIAVNQIRDLSIEDLLPRTPVGLDRQPLKRLIEGRRVMVTGAGGSIGSELCRQIAALAPARLVLYERYENNLYTIATDLADRGDSRFVHAVLGDVTDVKRLDSVMAEHRPEIVFHAAAHKHVPLMELNVCEAVKNNVAGTRLLVEAAKRHAVHQFVFISTDKAVNPTSVMGATKRVAELVLQTHAPGSATLFATVRFGNVLGSNGSVVPRFLEQIRTGGPVTITHPEIRRFFMLIPEAVQLVLHAAAQKAPGMVYVLEMGEQIKLVDLARNLIRLAGFAPDEEIAISYVGLRPGEKLFEELVAPNEAFHPSPVEQVLQVKMRYPADPHSLGRQVANLERLALLGDAASVLDGIREIVPEFAPPDTLEPAAVRAATALAKADTGRTAPVQREEPEWTVQVASRPAPDLRSIDVALRWKAGVFYKPLSAQDAR